MKRIWNVLILRTRGKLNPLLGTRLARFHSLPRFSIDLITDSEAPSVVSSRTVIHFYRHALSRIETLDTEEARSISQQAKQVLHSPDFLIGVLDGVQLWRFIVTGDNGAFFLEDVKGLCDLI